MERCPACSKLDEELRLASETYVSLVVQHDKMVRDSKLDDDARENAIRKARRRRTVAARLLLVHRRAHEDLSRPATRAAGQG